MTTEPAHPRDTLELYTDAGGDTRWRYLAANGNTLADGAEGYKDPRDALAGAGRVLFGDPTALELEDLDDVPEDAPSSDSDHWPAKRLVIVAGLRTLRA